MSTPALTVSGLAHRYGRRIVLRDVSFEVHAGEVIGIVGENGAGKSTLLRAVVGLLRPVAGVIALRGRLGYCDQEPALFPDLTVDEHFRWLARAYGLAPRALWEGRRDILLDRYAFDEYRQARIATLSGGTRQKLHLALALLHEPAVLVLDEPYQAFDWETYLRFWDHTEALRRQGVAIVIVSHLVHDRERFTRIMQLRDGTLSCA